MTKKNHECKDCKRLTGTPRPAIYCKICEESYLDFCTHHYKIENSWELKYD